MKKILLASLMLSAFAHANNAAWESNDNHISFLSIKVNQQKNSITEQSAFTSSKAMLDKDGMFTLNIDLNSVKTNIDIRDQRLKDWVFETAQFGTATVSGKVDADAVNKLAVGETLKLRQPLVLDIHGQKINLQAELSVQRVADDKIMVNTLTPVILDTKDMKMEKGVMQLVEVMALSSIVEQVPVSFSGEFMRK
ncbi:MAG: YceI family protein [Cardiobacteriaceae bacterium]|nr:YceI family protein [Cardiobacteriaceae bacterium]